MTCGEVYCTVAANTRVLHETAHANHSTTVLYLDFSSNFEDTDGLELYSPLGLLSWSIGPRFAALIG
jgi:hypothetical protein